MSFSKRQVEIIGVATQLIHEGGIQNVTTKNIAKVMGFTEPSIYRHFDTKAQILQSILLHYRQEMKMQIAQLDTESLTARKVLEQMLVLQFKHFSSFPAIATVIFSEGSFQNDTQLTQTVASIVKAKKERIVSILERGQQEGSVRSDVPAETLAVLFLGSMRFTILEWRLNNCISDLSTKAKQLIQGMEKWL